MSIRKWNEISLDPNAPEVRAHRIQSLSKARSRNLISNRNQYLCSLVKGKSILDVGVVEHFTSASESEEWLHAQLSANSLQCLGVDILENEVAKLKEKGYNVLVWDITRSPLDSQYELIIIGDVIEHLGNPSALFSNLEKMLTQDGRVILTTPNPWYANAIIKNVFEGKPFTDSADHVAWYDSSTLYELSERNNLKLVKYTGIIESKANSWASKIFFGLAPAIIWFGIKPEFFSKTIIYEFSK